VLKTLVLSQLVSTKKRIRTGKKEIEEKSS